MEYESVRFSCFGNHGFVWRRALENTLADPRCRYLRVYNWDKICDNEAALSAIRQVSLESAP